MTKRILVVDDEDHIREVAHVSMETVAGWEVVEAASGEEGIAKAWADKPDAILLDVMMPGMDGPATLERLKANDETSHIPVILLTAKVQADDRRRFELLPVTGVIAKPFDPIALSGDVIEMLGWGQ